MHNPFVSWYRCDAFATGTRMNELLLRLTAELEDLASKVAYGHEPGHIHSITSRRRKMEKGGKPATFDVMLITPGGRNRWKCWVWPQTASNGLYIEGGPMTIPEPMLEKPLKKYTSREMAKFLEAGQEKWGVISEAKKERSEKRKERSQQRYDTSKEYGDQLVKGETYYWQGSRGMMSNGIFTGEIRNGKAKFTPTENDEMMRAISGRGRPRAKWVMLDRVYKQVGSRFVRITGWL